MSHRGHKGRCFRAWRGTEARKFKQGVPWTYPIAWKVPQAIAPFLSGEKGQRRAQFQKMGNAIAAYAKHQNLTGKGAPVRPAGNQAR